MTTTNAEWIAKRNAHRAMLSALESGTATPEQQIAAFAHIKEIKNQHNEELKEAARDARDSYSQGRYDGLEEAESRY